MLFGKNIGEVKTNNWQSENSSILAKPITCPTTVLTQTTNCGSRHDDKVVEKKHCIFRLDFFHQNIAFLPAGGVGGGVHVSCLKKNGTES